MDVVAREMQQLMHGDQRVVVVWEVVVSFGVKALQCIVGRRDAAVPRGATNADAISSAGLKCFSCRILFI